jgi:uncharacterized YigZ family protein
MNGLFFAIKSAVCAEYKDKGSRFIAYAWPVQSESEVKIYLNILQKEHFAARHHCYAYVLGSKAQLQKSNDAGEPTNTAGKPILGQIVALDLSNVLIVVVRYFGGTLLGKGGLARAYKTAAQLALNQAERTIIIIERKFKIGFAIENSGIFKRLLRQEKWKIMEQKFEQNCEVQIAIDEDAYINAIEKIESLGIFTLVQL